MVFEDVGVGRVHDGILDVAPEEVFGIFDEELIKGVPAGDEDDQRLASTTPHPPSALPDIDDGAGVADQHAHVQAADVDAQFEGRGGHDAEQLARVEGSFDLAPFLGQVAGAVRRDDLAQLGMVLRCRAIDEFGDHPRPREDDRSQPAPHAHPQ